MSLDLIVCIAGLVFSLLLAVYWYFDHCVEQGKLDTNPLTFKWMIASIAGGIYMVNEVWDIIKEIFFK